MNSAEKQAVLHCLKSMIDEEACEECPLYGTTGTDHCEKDCVRLAINALSNAENPNKWIPCSERLPNFAGVYLVTRYFPNNVMNPTYLVDACFFDGIDTWHNDNRINHDRKYLTNVVAWLEEPEPYKEIPTWAEGSEKECTKNI